MKCRRSFVIRGCVLILTAFLLSACGLIYTDIHVPRSYRSASPVDVQSNATDKLVTGEACNYSVLFLVAWGNGGFVEAVKDALEGEPPGSVLYDVQTDTKANVYALGVYTRLCTIVSGRVATL
ncbi:MAG: TRL domain-containing protein [Nitrospiraceae bacterium]